MSILDGKGRLFGKVNLLDLVVLLAVLAVGGRFGYERWQGQQVAPTGMDVPMQLVIRFGAVAEPTLKWVKVGDKIYDSKSKTYLGNVTAVRHEPAIVVTTADDGRTYEQLSKNRFDFYVTVSGNGRVSPTMVTMSGLEMKIGRTNYVVTDYWSGYGVTWDIITEAKK